MADRHKGEFGLCIGWLSHIPKLHFHQCISEGRLQHPYPFLVLSFMPPSFPSCAPQEPWTGFCTFRRDGGRDAWGFLVLNVKAES